MKFYKFIILTILFVLVSNFHFHLKSKSKGLFKIINKYMNGFCDKKDDTCSTTVTWIKANFLKDEKLIFNNIDKKDNNDIFTNSILDKIVEELKRKRAVIISLRPDHHFLVLQSYTLIKNTSKFINPQHIYFI